MISLKKVVKIAGEMFQLGDKGNVVVPALTVAAVEELQTVLKKHDEAKASSGTIFDLIPLRNQVILKALQRNYPDATLTDVAEDLHDMSNSEALMSAAMGTNRAVLKVKDLGEDNPIMDV